MRRQQGDKCHLIDAAEAKARAIAIHDPRTLRPHNLHEQLGGGGDNVFKYLYGCPPIVRVQESGINIVSPGSSPAAAQPRFEKYSAQPHTIKPHDILVP